MKTPSQDMENCEWMDIDGSVMYIISTRYVTFLLSLIPRSLRLFTTGISYRTRTLPTYLPADDERYEQEQNRATVRCYEGWMSVVFLHSVWMLAVSNAFCVFRACHVIGLPCVLYFEYYD